MGHRHRPAAAAGVRWLLLALGLVLAAGLGLLYLETQLGPILCTSSGNIGAPAPTPAPPAPCPSGFGDLP